MKNKRRLMLLIALVISVIAPLFMKNPTPSKVAKPVVITKEASQTAQGNISTSSAHVVRVVDGDTIELSTGQKVRYIGVDTPETVDPRKPIQCFGAEAREINRGLVEGKDVRLVKDVSEADKYGRLLRYVYVEDVFINDYLVRQGYAHASTFAPDVAHAKEFAAAQAEAMEDNRGLWAGCKK